MQLLNSNYFFYVGSSIVQFMTCIQTAIKLADDKRGGLRLGPCADLLMSSRVKANDPFAYAVVRLYSANSDEQQRFQRHL